MTTRSLKVFLDTSAIFAAVLSPTGGARTLLRLGEVGVLNLVIGPTVLRECEAVVRRKAPDTLPTLAAILEISQVEITDKPLLDTLAKAKTLVDYPPDAYVLAEAIGAVPDWFVTHDKQHLLGLRGDGRLDFRVGTPGDLLQYLKAIWSD